MKKDLIDKIAIILLIAGGLNWGLVGIFNFNLVTFITFGLGWLETVVYGVVGVSALYGIKLLMK